MLVRDVMTVGVITVAPEASVKEVAQLLLGAHIGGVPVVDGGSLLGIVTSTDILTMVPHASHIRTAADVMHRAPVCLTEDTSVAAAARVLSRHRIKRAPVVRQGALVGIVTRSDLLRPYLRTDSEIRADVEDSVLVHGFGLNPHDVRVDVSEGVVTVSGALPDPRIKALLLTLIRAVDGVVDTADELQAALLSAAE